ncbi:MAG TPA: hypothetical protein VGL58_12235 [Caulobacteraceae bacterium]|jgi:hypothetical protein
MITDSPAPRGAEVRSFAPRGGRRKPLVERPPFARGEALALATAMRFRDAPASAVSACELDAALSTLSTERLQAFLTLDWRTQPARFEPPLG